MKKVLIFSTILLSIFCFNIKDTYAFSSSNYENKSLCGTFEVAGFHSDGVIDPVACYSSYEEAKNFMKSNGAEDLAIMTKVNGKTKIIDANVALLDLSVNPETLTYFYTNSELTGSAYTYMDTGSLYGGVDGVHLDTSYSNTYNVWTAKVKIGNFTGWIRQIAYEIVPITWVKSSSSYTVTSESIRHNYVAKIQETYSGSKGSTIGPKPDMLSTGTYYSYDGHYFYKDLTTLIKDNKNNTYQNAVNKNDEYYNYYMYLSNHTKTSYSSINIDEYIRNSLGITQDAYGNATNNGSSRLYGKGTFFYYAQEKYGVNAVLSLSLSRNETGNGKSNLAINKNNGFGLNAVDSSPTESANWYASFASSILGYASKWITYGYAHPRDWRYFGPQFGDKWIGMNVKYASDTYWSEKMAANYYSLDKSKGLQDYNYYQLGVVTRQVNAMSDSNNSSKFVYSYPEKEDAVVIVGEKQGESVNGNTTWYKVVSDLNIDENYNEVTSGDYNWDRYVYIPAAYVKKINKGKNGYISPTSVTEYQNKDYEYDLLVEDTVLKPKVGISTKETNYYYDSSLLSKKDQKLLKNRYVMVYSIAYDENNNVVSYLVTSDYKYDQKEWVSADSIKLVSSSYGKVSVTVSGNQYTWVNSIPEDTKATLISGQYTNSYVPVLEQKTINGYLWYKVPVDLSGTNNEFGWTLASAPGVEIILSTTTVENNYPTITAVDKTLIQGAEFNEKDGVTAKDIEDGDLTSSIQVTNNTVNINEVGTYEITYQVTDKQGAITTKTIKVIVKENKKPTLTASDITTTLGKTKPDLLKDVTATDEEDGNLTENIIVDDTEVNYDEIGEYIVTYKVQDSFGNTTTKEVKLIVRDNQEPIIYASDKTITIGNNFNEKDGVTATDEEDGDITESIKIIENTVNEEKIGTYKVTYQVTDNHNHTVEKTISVEVIDKEEKKASFFLDYIKEVDGKLEIKGYNAIKGINNDLSSEFKYKIIYENIYTGNEYSQEISRITDKSEITRPVYSEDNKDYTYSWYKGSLNIDELPDGDYKIYIVSENEKYYAKTIISNKVLRNQAATYTSKKTVTTRNNYLDEDISLELVVRTDKIGNKTSNSVYNEYNQYRTLEFDNELLHIKGTSYSIGMDLSKNANVTRKIIFENISDYSKYEYDLGSITDGLYTVGTTLGDGLLKDRAWFDAKFDISNIPKGKYAIYINTESNVSDYSELNELLFRSLDDVVLEKNGLKYSFKVNDKQRYRIELIVE